MANEFFDKCKKAGYSPVKKITDFQNALRKVAGTLEKSINDQREVMEPPQGNLLDSPPVSYSPALRSVTETTSGQNSNSPPGVLPTPESFAVQAFQNPSENTPKNTSKDYSKEGGKPPAPAPIKELGCYKNEVEIPTETDVIPETKVSRVHHEDSEFDWGATFNTDSFMGTVFASPPVENFENEQTPAWVLEIEEKVRLGSVLARPELVKLAEYRLGHYVGFYRNSGALLNSAPNDVKQDFVKFVQWFAFRSNPDITFIKTTIQRYEKDPERWDLLITWIEEWQKVKDNPDLIGTMLSQKIQAQGRKNSSFDLDTANRLAVEAAFAS